MKDQHQTLYVGQIKRIARVLLRNQQQVLGFGANLLDRGHRGLYGQRQHLFGQVIEPAGEEIGVDRRQLESRIAHVHRRVKRRGVLHPFEAKPALDSGHGFQDALLEIIDGPGERGDEMGNHGVRACLRSKSHSRHVGMTVRPARATARQTKKGHREGGLFSGKRPLRWL